MALFVTAAQQEHAAVAASGAAYDRCRDDSNGGGVRVRALVTTRKAQGAASMACRVAWSAAYDAYRHGGPHGSADLFEALTQREARQDPGTIAGIIDALFAPPAQPR